MRRATATRCRCRFRRIRPAKFSTAFRWTAAAVCRRATRPAGRPKIKTDAIGKMENNQHSTFNAERPSFRMARAVDHWAGQWALNVECSMLNVLLSFLLLAPFSLTSQLPPQLPLGGLIQLQVAQPAVDVSSPVTATTAFDPPVVRAGEKTFYRVNVDATESSIEWPEAISAPAELRFGANARGQMTQLQGNKFRPLASFVYEVQTTVPGHFTVTNFSVTASGQMVEIPAASLEVVAESSNLSPARRLGLEISATNVFLGQPFHVRVTLPSGPGNEIEALREIQFNGDGLMTDKTASRQSIEMLNINGQPKSAFVCDLTVTAIAAGPLKFSAQGFPAGREFSGPISIHGQVSLSGGPAKYVLLVSDPLAINVRPLPVEGEQPGFTGAIGKFLRDPSQLATNRLRVGEPVQLKIIFRGEGDLTRLVPPVAPRSPNCPIFAYPPPAP